MAETPKEKADRIAHNHLTLMRVIMIRWLESYFESQADLYNYTSDPKTSKLVVLDYRADLDGVPEEIDRVIVKRETFQGQNKFTDNRSVVDQDMFTHTSVKPRLGYIKIFCESRNEVFCDYLATQIENILVLHKEDLLQKGLVVGEPTLMDVRTPIGGTGFSSVLVTVPTVINMETSFSIKNPSMVGDISASFGIGVGSSLEVETGTN